MNTNFELLQYYVYKRLISRKEINEILDECKRLKTPVREFLLAKQRFSEAAELEAFGEYLCMPTVEIDMLEIEKELFDLFTYDFMKKHKIIPIKYDKNGVLLVATSKPLSCHTRSALAVQINSKIDYILVPSVQIERYVDSISAVVSTTSALEDLNSGKTEQLIASINGEAPVISQEDDVINNPAVRLVDSIIKEAIPYRASDIHIEPYAKDVRVRYRIDGDLHHRAEFPIEAYSAICARLKILSGINIAERRIPQDGRINMVIGGKEFDFRVSTLPTVFGEKFVIRILDKTSFQFTRADLGFTDEENLVVDKMLARPHGIILLTGPTGCGKSTTLYSFLKEVNDSKVNIVTVEDPVEYTMAGVNQTQVNTKANMTFAAALRSILRQDPDIIMIGEIRDEETAEIAVRSAITGHLVFSTLHTNDAPGAILRLSDMGVQKYLLTDALIGVIAQRLVKKLCPACKKKGRTNAKEMEILGIDEPISIARPHGCQFCNGTGYKGRITIHEMMYMNDKIKSAVMAEADLESLRKLCVENGMVTLWDSCRNLVFNGLTSLQELMTLNIE